MLGISEQAYWLSEKKKTKKTIGKREKKKGLKVVLSLDFKKKK